jgi:hypothetical protein
MELAEGIRKIGFRRWHERQLLESHLYLVTSLLSAIAVFAALESVSSRVFSADFLLGFLVMLACGPVAAWAFMHYVRMLLTAQYAAEHSVCTKCKTYGLLEVTGAVGDSHRGNADVAIVPTPVRCRKCGHEWTIS